MKKRRPIVGAGVDVDAGAGVGRLGHHARHERHAELVAARARRDRSRSPRRTDRPRRSPRSSRAAGSPSNAASTSSASSERTAGRRVKKRVDDGPVGSMPGASVSVAEDLVEAFGERGELGAQRRAIALDQDHAQHAIRPRDELAAVGESLCRRLGERVAARRAQGLDGGFEDVVRQASTHAWFPSLARAPPAVAEHSGASIARLAGRRLCCRGSSPILRNEGSWRPYTATRGSPASRSARSSSTIATSRSGPVDTESIEAFVGKRVHAVIEKLNHFVGRGADPVAAQGAGPLPRRLRGALRSPSACASCAPRIRRSSTATTASAASPTTIAATIPFDRDESLGIEQHVGFALDGEGRYRVQGIIDRIARAPRRRRSRSTTTRPGAGCRRSRNSTRIASSRSTRSASAQRYGTASVRLVWHYLLRDQVRVSTRTPEQLDELRARTIELIDRVEAETEFAPQPSTLCSWCEFQRRVPRHGGEGDRGAASEAAAARPLRRLLRGARPPPPRRRRSRAIARARRCSGSPARPLLLERRLASSTARAAEETAHVVGVAPPSGLPLPGRRESAHLRRRARAKRSPTSPR